MRRSKPKPNGTVATPLIVSTIALSLAGVGLWWLTRFTGSPSSPGEELIVYCAAAAAPAVEPILEKYEAEKRVRTLLQVGSSGALEAQLRLSGVGELYLPAASEPYLKRLQREGLAIEAIPVARLQLVLAFREDAPVNVLSLRELIDSGVPFGLCNTQAAAGQRTRTALEGLGLWEEVSRSATASMMTVTELAGAIRDGGRLRAGILWNTTAKQFGLRATVPPELAEATASIAAGVLASSDDPERAARLARYLAAPDGGRDLLLERGYELGGSR